MGIEVKKLSNSEIEIVGEIPAEDFEHTYQHALTRLNNKTNMPGFRKGHIPEHMLVQKIGGERVLRHAAEDAIQSFYEKIILEQKIEAIGRPSVTITKIARKNPLGFVLKTAVLPAITLPDDYKMIAKEIMRKKEESRVEEKEIEETFDYLRKSRAKESKAQSVTRFAGASARQVSSQQSEETNIQGEQHIHNDAGEIQLPELDDAFAQSVGPYKTIDELKNVIRTNILYEKETKAREKKRMEVLDAVASRITAEIPAVLIESEKEKMAQELRSSVQQMGLSWENYLSHVKKTEEEMKNGWNNDAQKRVVYGLILRRAALQENISVQDKEIDEYVRMIKMRYPENERAALDEKNLRDYAYGIIKNEKTFQILELTE